MVKVGHSNSLALVEVFFFMKRLVSSVNIIIGSSLKDTLLFILLL